MTSKLIWHKRSRDNEKKFNAIDRADNSMKVEPIESHFSCHLPICSVHVQSYTRAKSWYLISLRREGEILVVNIH